jgi:hypothetical protein
MQASASTMKNLGDRAQTWDFPVKQGSPVGIVVARQLVAEHRKRKAVLKCDRVRRANASINPAIVDSSLAGAGAIANHLVDLSDRFFRRATSVKWEGQ